MCACEGGAGGRWWWSWEIDRLPHPRNPHTQDTRHKTQEQKQARHLTTSHTTIDSECFGCAFGAEDYDHFNDGPTPRFAQNTAARGLPARCLLSLARQLMTREQQQQGSRARLFLPFASFPFPLDPTQFPLRRRQRPPVPPGRVSNCCKSRGRIAQTLWASVCCVGCRLGARACWRLWAGMVGCSMLGVAMAAGGRARRPLGTKGASQPRVHTLGCARDGAWLLLLGRLERRQTNPSGGRSLPYHPRCRLAASEALLVAAPANARTQRHEAASGGPSCRLKMGRPLCVPLSYLCRPSFVELGGGKQQHGRGRDGRSPRFKEAAQGGGGKGPRKPPSGGALRGTERPRHSAVRGAGEWLWMGAGLGWQAGLLARSTLGAGCWLGPPTNTNTYPPTHIHMYAHTKHTGQGW